MNSKKRIIINIIAFVCAIIVFILGCILIFTKRDEPEVKMQDYEIGFEIVVAEQLQDLNIRNKYYIIKQIVENYYYYLSNLEDITYGNEEEQEIVKKEIEDNKNRLLGYFCKDMILEYSLNLDNLQNVLGTYNNFLVNIDRVKYIELERLTTYFVTGKLIEETTGKIEDFKLMIVIDSQNSTFNVYTNDYIENHNYQNFNKESFNRLGYETIENRIYNKYNYQIISDETICKDMLCEYVRKLKYNPENAYELLNKDYRRKKFEDINEFKNYANNMYSDSVLLKSYSVENNNGKTIYVCIDKNEKQYLFYSDSLFDYSVYLDTYTVDLPEFIEKYDSANVKEKVVLNINKFIDSLNDKDYKYAYNCLAESFRDNKFDSQEIFEEYIKENLFENNSFKFVEFANEGEIYICNLIITDKNAQQTNEINMQIIMGLGEERDFEMSFSI